MICVHVQIRNFIDRKPMVIRGRRTTKRARRATASDEGDDESEPAVDLRAAAARYDALLHAPIPGTGFSGSSDTSGGGPASDGASDSELARPEAVP